MPISASENGIGRLASIIRGKNCVVVMVVVVIKLGSGRGDGNDDGGGNCMSHSLRIVL